MTTVWPVRARICVVASRVLMTGAPNWVSAVALLVVLFFPGGFLGAALSREARS